MTCSYLVEALGGEALRLGHLAELSDLYTRVLEALCTYVRREPYLTPWREGAESKEDYEILAGRLDFDLVVAKRNDIRRPPFAWFYARLYPNIPPRPSSLVKVLEGLDTFYRFIKDRHTMGPEAAGRMADLLAAVSVSLLDLPLARSLQALLEEAELSRVPILVRLIPGAT